MSRPDFDELVRMHSRSLYGYAYRFLRNQMEAEDAVQEVFIKIWNLGKKLDEYNSIAALAVTMTKNYCIDQIRKKKIIEDDYPKENIQSINSSPHKLLEDRESGEIMFSIIEGLPDIYKEVIRLKEIEGFSYEEIAVKTNQNINTLRVNLSRARKLIRDEYNKYQYERRGFKEIDRKVL